MGSIKPFHPSLHICPLSINYPVPKEAANSYSENIFFALLLGLNQNYSTGMCGLINNSLSGIISFFLFISHSFASSNVLNIALYLFLL